ncbi:MAG: hypothetical protein LBT04_03020 [Prevotellaceae bacterium]|jgi:hypothetical protein|nr:hypothetical protein [Prevotellaceae bacterium]
MKQSIITKIFNESTIIRSDGYNSFCVVNQSVTSDVIVNNNIVLTPGQAFGIYNDSNIIIETNIDIRFTKTDNLNKILIIFLYNKKQ